MCTARSRAWEEKNNVVLTCRNSGIFGYKWQEISSFTYVDVAGGKTIFFAQMWGISLTTKLLEAEPENS